MFRQQRLFDIKLRNTKTCASHFPHKRFVIPLLLSVLLKVKCVVSGEQRANSRRIHCQTDFIVYRNTPLLVYKLTQEYL